MSTDIKPIYMLSDSQLLFWQEKGSLFLKKVKAHLPTSAKAAYIGASNGDVDDYFQIFQTAMDSIDVKKCRMIKTPPTPDDQDFLNQADLILLSGGDVKKGWDLFKTHKMRDTIIRRYGEGAVLIGTSAGAIQLGKAAWPGHEPEYSALFRTFGLVPIMVSVREEPHWDNLKRAVPMWGDATQGIGIPAGGGLIYYPDHTLEAIRHPAFEVWYKDEAIKEATLFPGDDAIIHEKSMNKFNVQIAGKDPDASFTLENPEILDKYMIN